MAVDLLCPVDQRPLDDQLRGDCGHSFRAVAGIPILVTGDEPTHGWCDRARELQSDDYPAQRLQPGETPLEWVQRHAVATCGRLYQRPPDTYPIPALPGAIAPRNGGRFLEIGCAWGRWCLAAARAGYDEVVGVDPYVPALEVGRLVAAEREVGNVNFVSADGRHLPFADGSFDAVFSYSVFQHWSKDHVRAAVGEIARVLRPGGRSLIQLTNAYGLHGNAKRLAERVGRRAPDDIRYWTREELLQAFAAVGSTTIVADGFFTLNPRVEDLKLLPWSSRAVILTSETLRRVPGSARIADSVFVVSTKSSFGY